MKSRSLRKSVYNIVVVVFLVIALSIISVITYISNKDSERLSLVVTGLTENKYNIDKIDEAIQLLYKAENNSRLYVVTKERKLYSEYLSQLNRVSSLIVSIQRADEKQIEGLVEDKRIKTEIYINARLLADSLINDRTILSDGQVIPKAAVTATDEPEQSIDTVATLPKTTVEEFVVKKKSKKGLFGRIKDAIRNESQEDKVKNVTIVTSQPVINEPKRANPVVLAPLPIVEQQRDTSFASTLGEKERALLLANEVLFQKIKNLLQHLKNTEMAIHNQRQLALGNSANVLVGNLKDSSKYNLLLSLFLTVIILGALVLLYRNMRALQEAKSKAEAHARSKSEFIATLSHELRTPLYSIHAFTDELSKGDKNEGESEIIDAIKLSSNMLIAIVNNILDFTKMENGKFKLNVLPFTPSKIIEEVILGLTIQAKRKNLVLFSKLEDSTHTKIYGDPFQFSQLLINIVSNAIKYTEEGSVIVSANFDTTSHVTGILELRVQDTGVGIEQDRLSHIFDEYSSQVNNIEIKEGSTGLGLNIVKRIVDYHKGEVNIDSEIDKGTLFTVKLPYDVFLERNNVLLGKNKAPKRISKHQNHLKILIVENDQLNIKILNLLFKNENYIVSNAFNGTEALESHMNDDFDLIITDISMPGMSGYELARNIRELPNAKKSAIPIIAISGFPPPEDIQNNESTDLNAWLVKPFDTDSLLSKVDELVGNTV